MPASSEELERLRKQVAHYENAITWDTTCHGCAAHLDAAYAETVRAGQAEATVARVAAFRDYLATATADTETGALLLKVAVSLRDVLDGEHVPAARRWTEEELAAARARGRQRAADMEDLFDDGEPLAVSEEQTGKAAGS